MAPIAPMRAASFFHEPTRILAPLGNATKLLRAPSRGTPQLRRAYGLGGQNGAIFIEEVLGRGGHATVFGVYSQQAGRTLALRVAPLDEESRGSLMRSVWLQQACTSPSVIEILPPIFNATHAWTLMERGTSRSVEDLLDLCLKREKPLSLEQTMRLFACMAHALRACHARGVVHGDIKPDNFVLMSTDLASPQMCKLADFEMATLTGQMPVGMGTAPYIAPERLAGQPSHPAADLWSLGISLFQMLVGVTPHDDEDEREILRQIREDDADLSMADLDLILCDRGIPLAKRLILGQLIGSLISRDPSLRMSAHQVLSTQGLFT